MFGSNEWGQLGLGHNDVVNKPSRVKGISVAAAYFSNYKVIDIINTLYIDANKVGMHIKYE